MRIVSLVPSITEALCQLGLENSLVGITDFCTAPAHVVSQKVRVGGTKNPHLQRIAELRPDLVIVNTDENRLETARELQGMGLKILVTETDSLDQVETTWTQLGEATGRQALAARERERIRQARERNCQRMQNAPRLSALIMVWRSPWMASGSGTYMESLLAACGIDNVMSGVNTKWIHVALTTDTLRTDILSKASRPQPSRVTPSRTIWPLPCVPDVVLLPTEPFSFTEAHRDEFAHLLTRERVHVVDGELLSWWLSRTAKALEHFYQLHQKLTVGLNRSR
jgi:iron complex transport system substrate-binding protein